MKNKKLIIILAVLLIAAAASWYFFFRTPSAGGATETPQTDGLKATATNARWVDYLSQYQDELTGIILKVPNDSNVAKWIAEAGKKGETISREEAAKRVAEWFIWAAFNYGDKPGTLTYAGMKIF